MIYGLIGEKLGHSYSPWIHRQFGIDDYRLYEVTPDKLKGFLSEKEQAGFNVTMPYKKAVLPYCDSLSPIAQSVGAVNTLLRKDDGTLYGDNTDYAGFSAMLSGFTVSGKKVLVLGSGGASQCVCAVLSAQSAQPVIISRNGIDNYNNLGKHKDAKFIVNATPVGMYPNNGESPLSLDGFPYLEGVLDLIYNPLRTQLLIDAEKRGIPGRSGLYMLTEQARKSAELFLGTQIPPEETEKVYESLLKEQKNLILIGMPGCGKSTVGRLLAQRLGRRFVDIDTEILARTKRTPEQHIRQSGEEAFRTLEAQIIAELGMQSSLVIATGGGCVTVPENYDTLHQNGDILFLERDIAHLPLQGRPLSQKSGTAALYEKRLPLYRRFADVCVENNGKPEDTVEVILKAEGYL